MTTPDSTSMVIGSEALRLKLFLLASKLPVPRSFYRVAGTSSAAAEDRVGQQALVDALQSSMQASNNPGLAVDFGASIRPADMGIYGMVILTAPTLRDALERSVRFSRLMTDTGRIYLEKCAGGVKWVWSNTEPQTLGTRMRNEVVLTEHVAVVRVLIPGAVPRSVSFMHAEPLDSSRHRQFFDCPLAWSADENSVQWALEVMHTPLGVDASLGDFIEKEALRRLELLPASDLLSAVTDSISRRLPTGDVSLSTIAAALGRAPRSLRRELSDAGYAYRSLVDNTRRQRAKELADDMEYSMTDVAFKLGFSELSAFSRAWRRWFDVPFRAKK
ncbi:AraC family transcriptional regulator [Variovorax sp. PCZ-1]|uniref:AraC family transcriptional regulator n=1 Tax=Variovorax sp. PCZ-1 TaxID=2835533 RepID=UPI001BD0E504|nr:AraC family transcriptional regulator [Variovorax sp. PCZ-1]MBS7808773.1 AraC family transcriptional regulator ligand-binding domain-containing protein [Variovorax sp. PCZ-1]